MTEDVCQIRCFNFVLTPFISARQLIQIECKNCYYPVAFTRQIASHPLVLARGHFREATPFIVLVRQKHQHGRLSVLGPCLALKRPPVTLSSQTEQGQFTLIRWLQNNFHDRLDLLTCCLRVLTAGHSMHLGNNECHCVFRLPKRFLIDVKPGYCLLTVR